MVVVEHNPLASSVTRQTARCAAAVLGAVQYRNWIFRIGEDSDSAWLQVAFMAPDIPLCSDSVIEDLTKVADAEWRGRKWRLSAHMTEGEIIRTALMAVLAAEEHEARERFLWRGRAIFGPHMLPEAMWTAAGVTEKRE
jgi:hypothetical protein